jgi:hypothetical protein
MSLGKFQMTAPKAWQGLTDKNHVRAIFHGQPQAAAKNMIQLLAYNRGKSLENYLSQFPTKYFDTSDEFVWQLIGSSRRNIQLVKAVSAGSTITGSDNGVGAVNTRFDLYFAEDWFADGNQIVGEKNELYPLRVIGDGRPDGMYAVYTVELLGNVTGGMPGAELVAGKKFSKDFSPVEEKMSRQVGDIHFTSPTSMRNEWTTLRIKHEVPGNIDDMKIQMGIPVVDKAGNKTVMNGWMHYVDFKLEEEFSEEKNHAIIYSRSNRDQAGEYQNIGKSGNVIKMGSGIREQMEVSNTQYYGKFSIKLIEDMLYSLAHAKLGMGERRFMLRTGEGGAAQFHKAITDIATGWLGSVTTGSRFENGASIKSVSSQLHDNALSVGFQFVEWRAPNGVIVSVEVDPFYDDPVRNKIYASDFRGSVIIPAESYRYDILYIGTMDEPNIQIAKIKGQEEIRGYQWGFRNPFTGAINNDNMSFDEDKAVIHKQCTLGALVLDPSRTASLIPIELA